MKKPFLILVAFVFLFSSCYSINSYNKTDFDKAYESAKGFVCAVNNANASKVYDLLIKEYKDKITKRNFIKNFNHERTYPYLSPLFMYIKSIDIFRDGKTVYVKAFVASRLPGEIFEFTLHKEEEEYKVKSLEAIVDGSYVKMFNNIVKFD